MNDLERIRHVTEENGRMPQDDNPFPSHLFCDPVRVFIEETAGAMDCDPAYVALPQMAALAAAIGTSWKVQLNKAWSEPAILWAVVVGRSGQVKSPPLAAALSALKELEREEEFRNRPLIEAYREEKLQYDKALAKWRRSTKDNDPPPEEPDTPPECRITIADATVEKVAVMLSTNNRGLLLARDEVAGWLKSFGRYNSGGDAEFWLECHGGRSYRVDRKTGDHKSIYVPAASVSITGTIQPDILRKVLLGEFIDSGLAARMLFAYPPERQKRFSETDVLPATYEGVKEITRKLLALELETNEYGDPASRLLQLTPEAKGLWRCFVPEHSLATSEVDNEAMGAAYAKLEGYAARFALILALTDWAAAGGKKLLTVDADTLRRGIDLSRYFANEARKIYSCLYETEEERLLRKVQDFVKNHSGDIAPRDVVSGVRGINTAKEARAMFQKLAESGTGHFDHKRDRYFAQ